MGRWGRRGFDRGHAAAILDGGAPGASPATPGSGEKGPRRPMTGKIAVGGITHTDDLVLVRVLGARAGAPLASRALDVLGQAGINVVCCAAIGDLQDRQNLGVAIGSGDLDQTLGLLRDVLDEIGAERIEVRRRCSAIAVYGPQFSGSPAVGARIFQAADAAGVATHMITTSFTTVAFLVDTDDAEAAVTALHEVFVAP
ncbi:ACT domain-containing protein [bacterium]|nr:ACT domain-containing protein [bacterium]